MTDRAPIATPPSASHDAIATGTRNSPKIDKQLASMPDEEPCRRPATGMPRGVGAGGHAGAIDAGDRRPATTRPGACVGVRQARASRWRCGVGMLVLAVAGALRPRRSPAVPSARRRALLGRLERVWYLAPPDLAARARAVAARHRSPARSSWRVRCCRASATPADLRSCPTLDAARRSDRRRSAHGDRATPGAALRPRRRARSAPTRPTFSHGDRMTDFKNFIGGAVGRAVHRRLLREPSIPPTRAT